MFQGTYAVPPGRIRLSRKPGAKAARLMSGVPPGQKRGQKRRLSALEAFSLATAKSLQKTEMRSTGSDA